MQARQPLSLATIRIMSVNYFEPIRHWAVTQWRGQEGGYRIFGSGLGKAEALKRAALVARIFPEYAGCRVTPTDTGGGLSPPFVNPL
jgi:hypothetical protein